MNRYPLVWNIVLTVLVGIALWFGARTFSYDDDVEIFTGHVVDLYIYCGERADKLDGTIASLEYEIGEIEDILKQHREAIVEIQVKLIP